jgi:hypothetical protein
MNTYNDNLRSAVVESLHSQELELNKAESQKKASMFSLYYAEDATVSAAGKLETAKKTLIKKEAVKTQAVANGNLSTNVLESAKQEKSFVDLSISNAAVGAANVQVAANAIVRLASDIGSIFTILGAEDYLTDIYDQGKNAYEKMQNTAYHAEQTSQYAMEASAYTAEVSATVVSDKAKITNASVVNLLKVAEADYDSAAAVVKTDNGNLAKASQKEKADEGDFKDKTVDYIASKHAYKKSNKELNINLRVDATVGETKSFDVTFDCLQTAFNSDEKIPYPVQEYHIILVKESKAMTFSISEAENILLKGHAKQFSTITPTVGQSTANEKIITANFLDSDNKPMQLGTKYKVFVMAVYQTKYKKEINNFDDYLSAPSRSFVLTNLLSAASFNNLKPVNGKVPTITVNDTVTFDVINKSNFKVDYRLLLLPASKEVTKSLLTASGMEAFSEALKAEKKDDLRKENFQLAEADLASFIAVNDKFLKNVNDKIIKLAPKKGAKPSDEYKALQVLNNEYTQLKGNVSKYSQELKGKADIEKPTTKIDAKLNFYFNLTLAEHIPAGSYTQGVAELKAHDKIKQVITATILESTTDNFGNRLINNNLYIPVMLSMSAAVEENLVQFTNALSDFATMDKLQYIVPTLNGSQTN